MSDSTAIEWTNSTWNPVTGCTRVSPGCANCYIERTPPFRMEGRRFERVGNEETTGVRLHPDRLDQPLRWRKPRRVFVCSIADLFHEQVPDEFIFDVLLRIRHATRHTFQVLTKRPERARDLLRYWYRCEGAAALGEPVDGVELAAGHSGYENLWLGVSIESSRFTWRADIIREVPAAVRFISAEPLLGNLFDDRPHYRGEPEHKYRRRPLDLTGIDWLIVGGESGPGARPMHPEWARELRDACLGMCEGCLERERMRLATGATLSGHACAGRTAFFFKQWGEWAPYWPYVGPPFWGTTDGSLYDGHHLPAGLNEGEPVGGWWAPDPADEVIYRRVGKKAAGRLLDGRTWDEMPRATVREGAAA